MPTVRATPRTLLTIAGYDPSSGAGMTADLQVFAAHGFFGVSAITALTVQSTVGVQASHPVTAKILAETLAVLAADLPPSGVKIGMLATEGNVLAVAAFLRRLPGGVPVVLDPVLRSTSGLPLLSDAGIAALHADLLPLVDWVTPNRAELAVLTGLETGTDAQVELASAALRRQCPQLNVVATGGDGEVAADDYVLGQAAGDWLRGRKIASRATHGTGCAFSSALLCHLLAGEPRDAPRLAKLYVAKAIGAAPGLGQGKGPMGLLWPLHEHAGD